MFLMVTASVTVRPMRIRCFDILDTRSAALNGRGQPRSVAGTVGPLPAGALTEFSSFCRRYQEGLEIDFLWVERVWDPRSRFPRRYGPW